MILIALPYTVLIMVFFILGLIWWPIDGGWIKLTNSWIALIFVCMFCAIFLFQDDIYHLLDKQMKGIFFGSTGPQQKHRDIPEAFKDNQKFQEMISGTVMAWMEKANIEKDKKKLQEGEIEKFIEQYKKTKKENIKWLFLFANDFLVQHSKDVLYEIYERHYVTEQIFQEICEEFRIGDKEAKAILEILGYLKFIKSQEGEIIITEIGSAYCTHLEQT